MRPVFVLLTDFGLTSPYVGQVKAVLTAGCRDAAIIDLTHEVSAHAVFEAAFLLAVSIPYLPPQSIVLAVVDPGVGTERAMLLLDAPQIRILAPDNGLLAPLAHQGTLWRISMPEAPSATFHGRDVLAPVAVRLALGAPPIAVATPWGTQPLVSLPAPPAPSPGQILTRVAHVDRFGNCLLELPANTPLPARILVQGRPARVVRTYSDLAPQELGVLRGSQGVWEIALREASAAHLLGLGAGALVFLTAADPLAPA
jgi:hypothetical protein